MSTRHEGLAMTLHFLELDDMDTAVEVFRQTLHSYNEDPDALNIAAILAERQGNLPVAMGWRRRAIANAACERAALMLKLGEREAARVLYHEALKVDRHNVIACDALGALYKAPPELDPISPQFGRPPLDLYDTPIGKYFTPSDAPGDFIIQRMKAGEVFESEIVEVVKPYVKPGSTVIDVGANLGQMSQQFSHMVGPAGRVYSIEADDYIFAVLQKNLGANGCGNVTPVFAAAYDKDGETFFYPRQDFEKHPTYGSYGIDPKATSGRTVSTIAIDSLNIEGPVSLIKVDVQGCDLFAMRGARQIIATHKPAIMFEFEADLQEAFGASLDEYMAFVESIGYRVAGTVGPTNYFILPK